MRSSRKNNGWRRILRTIPAGIGLLVLWAGVFAFYLFVTAMLINWLTPVFWNQLGIANLAVILCYFVVGRFVYRRIFTGAWKAKSTPAKHVTLAVATATLLALSLAIGGTAYWLVSRM